MKWLTFKTQREPGFRFNLRDLLLILAVGGVSAYMHHAVPGSSFFLLPLYIVFTFFLFCNVFRMGNRLEMFWYIPFAVIAGTCIYMNNIRLLWILVGTVLEPLKITLIVYRIVKGPYRGIGMGKSTNNKHQTKDFNLKSIDPWSRGRSNGSRDTNKLQ